MQEAETIQYAGEGYIYRCPYCQKVDRRGSNGIVDCRFCEKDIKLIAQKEMTEGLYSVIQEINLLETGTILGCSPEQLEKSNLAKAARSVGAEIEVKTKTKTKTETGLEDYNIQQYITSYKVHATKLAEIVKNVKHGKRILEAAASLCFDKPTVEELCTDRGPNQYLHLEVLDEARMLVLKEDNPGLDQEAKIKLLKAAGYKPEFDRNKRLYVFFGSTYAPECDSYVYWD